MTLAALLAAAAVHPTTLPALPSECRGWGGDRVVALACDPKREARAIGLTLGAQRGRKAHELGIGQLVGAEPLEAGETLSLARPCETGQAAVAVSLRMIAS